MAKVQKIYMVMTQDFYLTSSGVDHSSPTGESNIRLFKHKEDAENYIQSCITLYKEELNYTEEALPEDFAKMSGSSKTYLLKQLNPSYKWRKYIHLFEKLVHIDKYAIEN